MKRIIAIAFLAFFFGGVALAQEPKKTNDGYEPVNGDMMQPGESLPASRLVAGAYGFICAAVVVWVASVARRARRLEDEVDELKKKIQARG
ncbi:MAG: hypothetical protein ACXVDD_02925 [Polyangia bacterium]